MASSADLQVTSSASIRESETYRTEALDCLKKAAQNFEKGDFKGEKTETDRALQCLERSLALYPANHRTRIVLVSCAISAEDYQKARWEALLIYEDLDLEALRAMGDSVLHLSIAHAAKMLGSFQEAEQFATEAIELYPWDPQPYSILGEIMERKGDYEAAEHNCREALNRDKDPQCCHRLRDRNLYFSLCCLGSSLHHQGKQDEAESFLKQAKEVDGSLPMAWRVLSQVYASKGDEAQAETMAAEASKLEREESLASLPRSQISHPSRRGSGNPDYPTRATASGKTSGNLGHGYTKSTASGGPSVHGSNHSRRQPGSCHSGRSLHSRGSQGSKTPEKKVAEESTIGQSKDSKDKKPESEKSGGCFCCVDR